MNTTIQWGDLWTSDWKRWEQLGCLRREREMMMESEFSIAMDHILGYHRIPVL